MQHCGSRNPGRSCAAPQRATPGSRQTTGPEKTASPRPARDAGACMATVRQARRAGGRGVRRRNRLIGSSFRSGAEAGWFNAKQASALGTDPAASEGIWINHHPYRRLCVFPDVWSQPHRAININDFRERPIKAMRPTGAVDRRCVEGDSAGIACARDTRLATSPAFPRQGRRMTKWSSTYMGGLSKAFTAMVFAAAITTAGALGSAAATDAHDHRPESIRVVGDGNSPPYMFLDAAGKLQGYEVDMWGLFQAHPGIRVDLVPMDWASAQRELQAGRADVIDMLYRTPSREPLYDF